MSLVGCGKGIFVYGIEKVEQREKSANIIDIYFGGKSIPVNIHVGNLESFIRAVIPEIDLEFKDCFKNFQGKELLNFANFVLKGRALVVVTDFPNYLEYQNGGQNRILGYTGINIKGEYMAENLKELFVDKVTYKELYPNEEDDSVEEEEKE